MGDLLRGGIGFLISGALLFYLLRPRLRSAFASGESAIGNYDSISDENAYISKMTPNSGIEFLVCLLIAAAITEMLAKRLRIPYTVAQLAQPPRPART
jgi:hypothetical protein